MIEKNYQPADIEVRIARASRAHVGEREVRQHVVQAVLAVHADVEQIVVDAAQLHRGAGEVASAEGGVTLGEIDVIVRLIVRSGDLLHGLQRLVRGRAVDEQQHERVPLAERPGKVVAARVARALVREPAQQGAPAFQPLHPVREKRRPPHLGVAEAAGKIGELGPGLGAAAEQDEVHQVTHPRPAVVVPPDLELRLALGFGHVVALQR